MQIRAMETSCGTFAFNEIFLFSQYTILQAKSFSNIPTIKCKVMLISLDTIKLIHETTVIEKQLHDIFSKQ